MPWPWISRLRGNDTKLNDLIFPGENYRAPRSWTERAYHKLVYFNEVDKSGHFAAWEQPELFSVEVRAGLRSLRRSI